MQKPFIGMGEAPDGIELPLGLSMELTMHPEAAATFGRMSVEQKRGAIQYVQGCTSGEDARKRIQNVVKRMEQGEMNVT